LHSGVFYFAITIGYSSSIVQKVTEADIRDHLSAGTASADF
jgi:hypothetical protein